MVGFSRFRKKPNVSNAEASAETADPISTTQRHDHNHANIGMDDACEGDISNFTAEGDEVADNEECESVGPPLFANMFAVATSGRPGTGVSTSHFDGFDVPMMEENDDDDMCDENEHYVEEEHATEHDMDGVTHNEEGATFVDTNAMQIEHADDSVGSFDIVSHLPMIENSLDTDSSAMQSCGDVGDKCLGGDQQTNAAAPNIPVSANDLGLSIFGRRNVDSNRDGDDAAPEGAAEELTDSRNNLQKSDLVVAESENSKGLDLVANCDANISASVSHTAPLVDPSSNSRRSPVRDDTQDPAVGGNTRQSCEVRIASVWPPKTNLQCNLELSPPKSPICYSQESKSQSEELSLDQGSNSISPHHERSASTIGFVNNINADYHNHSKEKTGVVFPMQKDRLVEECSHQERLQTENEKETLCVDNLTEGIHEVEVRQAFETRVKESGNNASDDIQKSNRTANLSDMNIKGSAEKVCPGYHMNMNLECRASTVAVAKQCTSSILGHSVENHVLQPRSPQGNSSGPKTRNDEQITMENITHVKDRTSPSITEPEPQKTALPLTTVKPGLQSFSKIMKTKTCRSNSPKIVATVLTPPRLSTATSQHPSSNLENHITSRSEPRLVPGSIGNLNNSKSVPSNQSSLMNCPLKEDDRVGSTIVTPYHDKQNSSPLTKSANQKLADSASGVENGQVERKQNEIEEEEQGFDQYLAHFQKALQQTTDLLNVGEAEILEMDVRLSTVHAEALRAQASLADLIEKADDWIVQAKEITNRG